jgi:hypothetical protein
MLQFFYRLQRASYGNSGICFLPDVSDGNCT